MLTLDDEDLAFRPIGVAEPKRRFSGRLLGQVAIVALLGGLLGTGGYFLTQFDTQDVLGALDISDRPHLTFQMPETSAAPADLGIAGTIRSDLADAIAAITPSAEMLSLLRPPGSAAPESAAPANAGAAVSPAKPDTTKPQQSNLLPAALPSNPSLPKTDAGAAPTYASLIDRATTQQALPEAPVPELLVKTAQGTLPKIGSDGRLPWKVYSRPFPSANGRPKVAVMVTGLGLDQAGTNAAISKLAPDVTLVFSPYAGGLDKWVAKARKHGHEVWIALPTEGTGYPARDPGPLGLLVKNSVEENLARLSKVLGRAGGFVGVWVEDGTFARSAQMPQIAAAIKRHGLAMVGPAIKGNDLPASARLTESIAPDLFRDALEAKLKHIGGLALNQGDQLISLTARPLTFSRVSPWLDRIYHDGAIVAPASALVK